MSRTFRYDRVFGSESHQEKVYSQAIVPIVQEVSHRRRALFTGGLTGGIRNWKVHGRMGGGRLQRPPLTLSAA